MCEESTTTLYFLKTLLQDFGYMFYVLANSTRMVKLLVGSKILENSSRLTNHRNCCNTWFSVNKRVLAIFLKSGTTMKYSSFSMSFDQHNGKTIIHRKNRCRKWVYIQLVQQPSLLWKFCFLPGEVYSFPTGMSSSVLSKTNLKDFVFAWSFFFSLHMSL